MEGNGIDDLPMGDIGFILRSPAAATRQSGDVKGQRFGTDR
jgi:hypothetical protein